MKIGGKNGITRKIFVQQPGIFGTGLFFAGNPGETEFLSGRKNKPKKIIVVGAGLAGLAAAWELRKAGHEVKILEARDRPGGRVSTIREPFAEGLYAEEGAAAYSESYTEALKLIDEFKLEKIPWTMPGEPVVYHLNGERIEVAAGEEVEWPYDLKPEEQGKDPLALVKMYIIDTLPKEVGNPQLWEQTPLVSLDKVSLGEYLRKQGASEGAIKLLQNTMWFAALPGETSGLSMAMSDFGLFMGGMPFILKGGNDLLPKEMAKRLNDDLHYNVQVRSIRDQGEGVTISAVENGKSTTFEGDEVIVALPLKVLKNITFEPELSVARSKAIEEMPNLELTRVFFEVNKPFWREKGLAGAGFTDLPVMQVNAYHNAEDIENAPAILESYMAGENAQKISELSKKDAIEQQLQEMEKVHPGTKENFTGGYVKAWGDDPYALGGPSWPAPGDVTAYLKELQSPQGRIHFAGEYTDILRSTMEGALRSGIRAAREI